MCIRDRQEHSGKNALAPLCRLNVACVSLAYKFCNLNTNILTSRDGHVVVSCTPRVMGQREACDVVM